MPLPQIRDGQKLSLMLPADVVRRLKLEAIDKGTIPALIVLEALDNHWEGCSEASDPTTVSHSERRRMLERQWRYLETLMSEGTVTAEEIAKAAGVDPDEGLDSWKDQGYVPAHCNGNVSKPLASKKVPISRQE